MTAKRGIASVAALIASPAVGQVQWFDEACNWLVAAPQSEARAFDEFFPDTSGDTCNILGWPNPPDVVLNLAGGLVEVTSIDRLGQLACPLRESPPFVMSDAWLDFGGGIGPELFLEFDPPVTAFFTYYTNADGNPGLWMEAYDKLGVLVDEIVTPPSPNQLGVGIGFTSSVPVSRVRIHHDGTFGDERFIGAGKSLAIGESSLGTVLIPEYGWEVEYDFAVVWSDAPPPPDCAADLDGSGDVGVTDLLQVLGQWGPCPPTSNVEE